MSAGSRWARQGTAGGLMEAWALATAVGVVGVAAVLVDVGGEN